MTIDQKARHAATHITESPIAKRDAASSLRDACVVRGIVTRERMAMAHDQYARSMHRKSGRLIISWEKDAGMG
jgi:hypothetical protein